MSFLARHLRRAAGQSADPHFASVKLLCHMDGGNGSTTFTDVKGHALTSNGGAAQSTAQAKWGASSLLCGSGKSVTAANSADFDFAADFTLEAWIYMTSTSAQKVIIGAATPSSWSSGYTFGLSAQTLEAWVSGSQRISGGAVATNTWKHVALCRTGSTLELFYDGNRVATATYASALTSYDRLTIGNNTPNDTYHFIGHIDDVRITKGVARYSGATYTVPNAAFSDS